MTIAERPSGPIGVVVVLHESAEVIEACLAALRAAAPDRGVKVVVVDNASADDGGARAERVPGLGTRVVRLGTNRGFAAGVNAGIARLDSAWLAVVNPDLVLEPGALDRLADAGERNAAAGLLGPRVDLASGGIERTAGVFPTLAREIAHAFALDRLFGVPGRQRPQPERAEAVDWLSGCAWLLRREAWEAVGALDEDYFMYLEDVDYGWRLARAGWERWYVPEARALHARGTGSRASVLLPADGGRAIVRYFERHLPESSRRWLRSTLRWGWMLRWTAHAALGALGRRESQRMARRYALALRSLGTQSRD